MTVHANILETIGNTPLVRLSSIFPNDNVYAKLEYFNPASSIKDRVALNMIEVAEKDGIIKPGATIIEPTSGNTGLGLAMVCARKGYKLIIVMPDSMSIERQKGMKFLGAELVLTDGALGMQGAIDKALELESAIDGAFLPQQFKNPSNSDAHYKTTGPEIWEDLGEDIDVFVSAVGTGGTLTGTGKFLKEKKAGLKVIAVEPATSAVISGESAGKHTIQGIGAGFIPDVLDTGIIDEIVKISDDESYDMAKKLARNEGILCGISSGAAVASVAKIVKQSIYNGKTIVVILPDTAERYMSTKLFD
jgi:cysteine synthase A